MRASTRVLHGAAKKRASSGGGGGVSPLFEDDFSSYSNGSNISGGGGNGFSWSAPSGSVLVSTSQAFVGDRCLRFRYSPGNDNAEQRFSIGQNLTEVWFEFYIRFPATPNFAGNGNNKLWRLWGNDYGEQNKVGGSFWISGGGSTRNYQHDFNHKDWPDGTVGPADGPSATLPTAGMLGAWAQIRIHCRHVSGAGADDGILRLWRDGSLVCNFTNVPQKYGSPAYWNEGYFMGWANTQYSAQTDYFFDAFKIYDLNPGW